MSLDYTVLLSAAVIAPALVLRLRARSLSTMDQPSNAQQRIDKIQNVLQAVDNNRWRSYNEFQLAFYTSDQPDVRARAEGSLRFWPNRSATFMPRVLLDALEKRCPSRDAKNEFQRAICEKAAQIFTRELARGTADPTLKLRLDDPRLADDRETFGLSALLPRYIKLMPNLYRLLIALLVTRNRYERITGRTKKQKEGQASRVRPIHMMCAASTDQFTGCSGHHQHDSICTEPCNQRFPASIQSLSEFWRGCDEARQCIKSHVHSSQLQVR
jgi:hypothetical protein